MGFKLNWVRSKNMFGKRGLWNVNFAFTVRKVDIDTTRDDLTVCGWVEDVADGLAILEGGVCHLDLLGVAIVGQSNKEIAS